jgi:hypothetical protein
MQCSRCGGLMVIERFDDLQSGTWPLYFYGLRCLLCGEIIDPMVLLNRKAIVSSLVH